MKTKAVAEAARPMNVVVVVVVVTVVVVVVDVSMDHN